MSTLASAEISLTEVAPAAFCGHENILFTYEERDLFAGELFCPGCTRRTDVEDRAPTLIELRKRHPQAGMYAPAPPPSEMRPRAR